MDDRRQGDRRAPTTVTSEDELFKLDSEVADALDPPKPKRSIAKIVALLLCIAIVCALVLISMHRIHALEGRL